MIPWEEINCLNFPKVNQFLRLGNNLGQIKQMSLGILLSSSLPQILRISLGLNLKKRVWDEFSGLKVSQKLYPIYVPNFMGHLRIQYLSQFFWD